MVVVGVLLMMAVMGMGMGGVWDRVASFRRVLCCARVHLR